MKNNDCVDINKDFLATRLNYMLEHTVIFFLKKEKQYRIIFIKWQSAKTWFNWNNSQLYPDIPTPNAWIDPNEVVINATPEDSPNRSSIDTPNTPTCSNLPYDCPSQPYSLTSLKQNYSDLCAQTVDVKEFLFKEISFLKNKSYLLRTTDRPCNV